MRAEAGPTSDRSFRSTDSWLALTVFGGPFSHALRIAGTDDLVERQAELGRQSRALSRIRDLASCPFTIPCNKDERERLPRTGRLEVGFNALASADEVFEMLDSRLAPLVRRSACQPREDSHTPIVLSSSAVRRTSRECHDVRPRKWKNDLVSSVAAWPARQKIY